MLEEHAIVEPFTGRNTPRLEPLAVVAGSKGDLRLLCDDLKLTQAHAKRLAASKLYCVGDGSGGYGVAGPVIGAPYAAIVIETLIAWGARQIIFFGWCGSVSSQIEIGDIIVPTAAIIDEGTSRHYNGQWQPAETGDEAAAAGRDVVPASSTISRMLQNELTRQGTRFEEGLIWSTDAIFRETRQKVIHFQNRGALAVEMEMSALFTIGRFRQVEVGGILVVSDELATYTWRPGFRQERFIQGRRRACEVIENLCQNQLILAP